MKVLAAMLLSVIMLSSGFMINSPAIAEPNENANDNAKRTFELPDNAIQIAPGIFHVSAIHEGKLVEGIIAYHHRTGHSGGPGGGETEKTTGGEKCYTLYAKGAKWKVTEDYIIDPTNTLGFSNQDVSTAFNDAVATWEASSSGDFFGSETAGVVDGFDSVAPDNKNEVMFGDLGPNTLGVTVTWGYFSGPPPTRQLIEWDQIYNEVDFKNWSIDPDGAVPEHFDFLSVATHEMGHSAGLSHANDTCVEETMYPYISHSQDKERSLHAGDIAGIQNLYG
ncbi:MAG: matrixin family metalloprotease [Thaumarchaeota archaeon]|nr:matrixin family metalloprotease [Nitrososphaerota archaeon]